MCSAAPTSSTSCESIDPFLPLSSSSSSGRNGGINGLIASKDDSSEREGRKEGSRRRSWLLSTRWWSSLVVQLLGVCLLSKLHGHAALQAQIYVDGSVYDWEQTNDRSDPLSLLPRRKNKGGWWKEKEGIRRGSLDETRFLPPENHRERDSIPIIGRKAIDVGKRIQRGPMKKKKLLPYAHPDRDAIWRRTESQISVTGYYSGAQLIDAPVVCRRAPVQHSCIWSCASVCYPRTRFKTCWTPCSRRLWRAVTTSYVRETTGTTFTSSTGSSAAPRAISILSLSNATNSFASFR